MIAVDLLPFDQEKVLSWTRLFNEGNTPLVQWVPSFTCFIYGISLGKRLCGVGWCWLIQSISLCEKWSNNSASG